MGGETNAREESGTRAQSCCGLELAQSKGSSPQGLRIGQLRSCSSSILSFSSHPGLFRIQLDSVSLPPPNVTVVDDPLSALSKPSLSPQSTLSLSTAPAFQPPIPAAKQSTDSGSGLPCRPVVSSPFLSRSRSRSIPRGSQVRSASLFSWVRNVQNLDTAVLEGPATGGRGQVGRKS